MLYKAVVTFVGKVSMVEGEVREIHNKKIAEDLLRANYIIEAEPKKETPKKKATKKKSPKGE